MIIKLIFKLTVLFFLPILLVGCQSIPTEKVDIISVEELVNNRNFYDGKSIKIRGDVSYGFESCLIIPINREVKSETEDALKYMVWYSNHDCMTETKNFKHGIAVLKGSFNKNDHGHLGIYSTSIRVTEIEWE